MWTNDNRDGTASAPFAAFDLSDIRPAYATPGLADALDALVFDLWHLSGGDQGTWLLSGILGRVACHIGGEPISRQDRDRILIAIEEAEANFVPAMFDPHGLGNVVDDGLKALAALVVWWEQDARARATREPAEIAALLSRARLCRLEMDGLVGRTARSGRCSVSTPFSSPRGR